MAKTKGQTICVYNGATLLTYQRGASLTINGETVDTTTKDDSIWSTILPTWNNGEIQISGLADVNGVTQEALFTAISTQAALTLVTAVTAAGVAGSRFSGSFYLTKLDPVSSAAHDGVAEFTATGKLNGALSYTKV